MPRSRVWMLGVMLMLIAPFIGAGDAKLVDNPAYHSWDDAKIGTVVHAAGTFESRGTKRKMKGSKKLIERTPDALTFELSSITTDPSGKVTKSTEMRQVVPAKIPPDRVNIPDDIEGKAKTVRQETITIAGKAYKCTVIKIEGTKSNGAKSTTMRWHCDDVIGGTVRLETTTEYEGEKFITRLELGSIEIPKAP